jgi:hypothetical protein
MPIVVVVPVDSIRGPKPTIAPVGNSLMNKLHELSLVRKHASGALAFFDRCRMADRDPV